MNEVRLPSRGVTQGNSIARTVGLPRVHNSKPGA